MADQNSTASGFGRIPLFWRLGILLVSAILVFFLWYPILFILRRAFFPGESFSLEFFFIILKHNVILSSILNSFLIGILVTLCCLLISLPLSWSTARYKLRFQVLLTSVIMLPMVLPPFVGAIGIKQFLARFGTLNIFLMEIGLMRSPIDWLGSGFWGIVVLETLHLFPIVYLNLSASIANLDPSLEEAGRNLGCSSWTLARRILVPLASPGLFAGCAIVFIWSVTDLGTPLILEYRNVVAYQIFNMIADIYENPMGYALVVFLLLWVAAVYFTSKHLFSARATQMEMRGFRSMEKRPPGKAAHAAILAAFAIVGIVSIVPHMMVLLSSVSERWFLTVLPEQFTGRYYIESLHHTLTVSSIRNSLFLSSASTFLNVVLGFVAAYAISRFKFAGRAILDFSVMLPLALPGLILAFGYVGTFAGTMLDPRHNPFPLLIIAYGIRRFPFMVRSIDAGLKQMSLKMEEASLNLGASHLKTIYRITLPLVTPNIIAGGILVFAFAMLEVSDSLILAMKENYYPITKAIYALSLRISEGFSYASVLGVICMAILGTGMLVASKILGRKMGTLFRI